ncbi:MAG: sugar ABC transporter permease [Thermomicrobiales bacterium]
MAQVSGKAADPVLAGINPLQTGLGAAVSAPSRSRVRGKNEPLAYLFLLPAVAVLTVFHFFPLLFAFFISLNNWRIRRVAFNGLANYNEALHKKEFWQAFGNTVYFVIGTVPLTMAIALLLAYLLFQKVRFLSFFRTVYFLPYVTSTVAAAAVWTWIFNSRTGVLNAVIGGTFGEGTRLRWLQEPKGIFLMIADRFGMAIPADYPLALLRGPSLALVCIMMMTTWHLLGFDIVIFLAGLGNINQELYEAARLDGASEWAIFRRITIPLLMPTISFLTIISTIGAFKAFNEIYTMSMAAFPGGQATAGGPIGSTQTVVVYVYNQFYSSQRLGYGSAVAFLLFAVILGLTLVQLSIGRRRGAV